MSADPPHDDTLPASAPRPTSDPLAATQAASATPSTAAGDALPASLPGLRVDSVLGRGGMGEVLLAHDAQLGREIAVKRMRGASASDAATARFLREARIQARLDHPAIVPVHALGADRDGRPYFTMKRLAGTTLAEVLATTVAVGAGRQRLLRTLAEVCLAIDFAHKRGVVHRDLKPANVMLGDFGEVYVLDWGVARVLAEDTPVPSVTSRADLADGATHDGDVIGTPGYMAPEQVRGEPAGKPADVYALGVILFEILTAVPLHPRGEAALASTLALADTSPARRAPDRDVPPELDAACRAATASDPDARPTARALADALQHFLDGDRDVGLRRELAARHLATARQSGAGDVDRVVALREAGRALALDPGSHEAADLVTRLMLEPPPPGNPEVEQAVVRTDDALSRSQGRHASVLVLAFTVFAIPMLAGGIQSWPWAGALAAMVVVFVSLAIRDALRPSVTMAMLSAGASGFIVMMLSRLYGPFVFVPTIACAFATSLASFPVLLRVPVRVLVAIVLGLIAPLVLEATGVWSRTWSLDGGVLSSRSVILELDGAVSTGTLIALQSTVVIAMGVFARRQALDRRRAMLQVEAQAWRLRQLLPTK